MPSSKSISGPAGKLWNKYRGWATLFECMRSRPRVIADLVVVRSWRRTWSDSFSLRVCSSVEFKWILFAEVMTCAHKHGDDLFEIFRRRLEIEMTWLDFKIPSRLSQLNVGDFQVYRMSSIPCLNFHILEDGQSDRLDPPLLGVN